jgi:simple sugar transport system substrate-binding protein
MALFDPTRRDALTLMGRAGAAALAATALPSAAARAAGPAPRLTAGFVYIGPQKDWGWNESFLRAAGALRGVPGVRVVHAGYLPESTDYADGGDDAETRAYAAALDGLVAEGAGLVVSTSFDHDPFLLAAARKHPQVLFRQATALGKADFPANVGSQNALINQGHYVNGVAAGLCTTTNQIGFVAGMGFSPVLLNINSFMLGIRQTNPDATLRVIFTGGWEDAVHDAAAVNALVDAGCDVIGSHLDAPRIAIETAEHRGVKVCGHAFDQNALAPMGYITGADYHWTPMFRGFTEAVMGGRPLPNFLTGGYDKDYVRSSPFGAGANAEAIAAATVAMAAMRENAAIFVGPIRDNTGKVVVPAGTTLTPYADELQRTDWLIEGVIGAIP